MIGGLLAVAIGVGGVVAVARSDGALKGTAMAITGALLGVASAGAWGALIANTEFRDGFREGFTEAARSGEPAEFLDRGDCVDIDLEVTSNVTPADVVDCGTPHSAEYIGSAEVLADARRYPGEHEVFLEGDVECRALFRRLIGVAYEDDTEYELWINYPDQVTWDVFGDRTVDCYIGELGGGDLVGSVTG